MPTLDELRQRPPVTASEVIRFEGSLPTYVLIEGQINALAEEVLKKDQGFIERVGRSLGLVRSQPKWEGWSGWGAGRKLKCAALELAGWSYDESHLPYEQAAHAFEKVRLALLSPECQSADDLLNILQNCNEVRVKTQ
ncbi:hypothetical protein [Pseudomonas sp. Irchel 3E13]|uniref:hypothetical protein n=1 Tax=Pseudomonas sp. Irchel 3E13 TaxID=2008975 RepID=UPI000BA34354|nr:hypothetical protein [Pseudomonas sp. Irchel 3E13]